MFGKGVWRCLRIDVNLMRHATLLSCAEGVNVRTTGAGERKEDNDRIMFRPDWCHFGANLHDVMVFLEAAQGI